MLRQRNRYCGEKGTGMIIGFLRVQIDSFSVRCMCGLRVCVCARWTYLPALGAQVCVIRVALPTVNRCFNNYVLSSISFCYSFALHSESFFEVEVDIMGSSRSSLSHDDTIICRFSTFWLLQSREYAHTLSGSKTRLTLHDFLDQNTSLKSKNK